MKQQKAKNILILLTEIAAIGLMAFNLLPRELSLVITGILLFYFIFEPLEDSLWVFIASIPLFIALPITQNIDTLANWRILSIALFLILFFKQGISIQLIKKQNKWKLKEKFKHFQIEYLFGIFLILAIISLLTAENIWLGIKQIIFLINACLIFIVIRNLAFQNQILLKKIISAFKTAIGIVLGIGFLQLGLIFFTNLHQFWHWWDRHIINLFYGIDLSNLLSYSNTWFSYYSYQMPTLRIFSIFPDSHSFAFFCILALPFFLTLIYLEKKHTKRIINYILLIACLLAIIFSGSRGAWVGAGTTLIFFLFLLLANWSPTINKFTCFFKSKNKKIYAKKIQLVFFSLILFFILFPIASGILFAPQYIQLGSQAISEKTSAFERAKTIIDFNEASIKGRLEIWQRTADSILIHPWLGVGIGNYPSILKQDLNYAEKGSSAHSLYLQIAAEMGIFALIILLIIFYKILKRSWLIFNQESESPKNSFLVIWSGFFLLALVWILSYSVFDIVLLNDKVLLFFIANLAILYSLNYETN